MDKEQPTHQNQNPQQLLPQQQHQQHNYNQDYGYLSYPPPPLPPGHVPLGVGVPTTATLESKEQQVPNYQQPQVLNQKQDKQKVPQKSEEPKSNHDGSIASQGAAVPEKKDGVSKLAAVAQHSSNLSLHSEASGRPRTTPPVQNVPQAQPYFHHYPIGQPSNLQTPNHPSIPNHPPINQLNDCQTYLYQQPESLSLNQAGYYTDNYVQNIPPPNANWSPHQQLGYASSAHQFAPAGYSRMEYSPTYPTTFANTEVSQPSVSTAATNGLMTQATSTGGVRVDYGSTGNYRMEDNCTTSNVSSGSVPSATGFLGTSSYTSQASPACQNAMTPTNESPSYLQTTFNRQQPCMSAPTITGQSQGCAGAGDYTIGNWGNTPASNMTIGSPTSNQGYLGTTPFSPQTSSHSGMIPTNTSGYPQPMYNGQTNVNYFQNQANGRGMYATELANKDDNEERRKSMAYYENERLQRLYMSQGFTKRLVINPNVNIEAQLNQEYLQQCLQGMAPDGNVMERLYGSVNINAAGQTHNIGAFDVTNVHHHISPQSHSPQLHSPQLHSPQLHSPQLHSPQLHSPQLHSPDNPHAIHHTNYGRPPPPYPMPHMNILAIESARNEAKNAEIELDASTRRRKEAEEKIVTTEVNKRKMKARSQRMSYNEREAYLRFQYCGRETRNTRNYMNTSDDGLEEYLLQLEFEDARMAESRASDKVNAANIKLRAQLEEASRLEAAQLSHPPPTYGRNFNPVGGPIRQPHKRGRRTQIYQTSCRRSNTSSQEFAGQSSVQPPPSYPGTIGATSRPQHHQTPCASPYQTPNMGRNPPDYYQAVGSSPSEFRIQHPRRIATAQAYGQNQYSVAQQAATAQATRRPVRRAMTQKSAPVTATTGTQQHHGVPQGNRYSSAGAHPNSRGQKSQMLHDPASNMHKVQTGYPVRQTRSTSRMFGEEYFNNRASWGGQECRMNRSAPNPTGASHISTQVAPNTRSVFPASHQPATTTHMARQGTNTPGVKTVCKPPSKQADSNDMDNIENLIPTLPAMSNTVFERCLKEMTPDASKENQRTEVTSQSCNTGRVQTRAATLSFNSGSSTTDPYGRKETRSPQSQSASSMKSILEKELDEYFVTEAKRIQEQNGQDDFDVEELLKD